MKKIIIAITCCMITELSFAAESVNKVSEQLCTSWDYTPHFVPDSTYPNLPSASYVEGVFVSTIAAKNIYENGAKICPMFFLSLGKAAWVDTEHCVTFCKRGFYGSDCSQTLSDNTPIECDDSDFTTTLKKPNSLTETINTPTDVFFVSNKSVIPLVVTNLKEHAVEVSPGLFSRTKITESPAFDTFKYAAGKHPLLCAQGYILNQSKTDCIRPNRCNARCPAGEGFTSKYDTTCKSCSQSDNLYVDDDGVCQECKLSENKISNGNQCIDVIKVTKAIMKNCFNDADFKTCVKDSLN